MAQELRSDTGTRKDAYCIAVWAVNLGERKRFHSTHAGNRTNMRTEMDLPALCWKVEHWRAQALPSDIRPVTSAKSKVPWQIQRLLRAPLGLRLRSTCGAPH